MTDHPKIDFRRAYVHFQGGTPARHLKKCHPGMGPSSDELQDKSQLHVFYFQGGTLRWQSFFIFRISDFGF